MILLHKLTAVDFKQFDKIEVEFPDSGTILIEGSNEAGKSSLFEAVFFALYGNGLGGSDPIDRKELVRYGAAEAVVTLVFSVDGKQFTVTRRQKDNQKATLEIPQGDGTTVRVVNLAPVNRAIVEHIGLTAQSLLNTCFVEQKQLGHLESLRTDKREEAINELVNLKAISTLEDGLPRRADDDRRVRERQHLVKVAELDSVYVGLKEWQEETGRIAASASLRDIAARREKAVQEQKTLTDLRLRVSDLMSLHARRSRVEDLRKGALALWHTAEGAVGVAREALQKSEAAKASLPGLEAKVREAENEQKRLITLLQIEDEDTRFTSWQTQNAEAQARVTRTQRAQSDAESERQKALRHITLAEERDALSQWAVARRTQDTIQNTGPDEHEIQLKNAVADAKEKRDRLTKAAKTAADGAAHAETNVAALATQTTERIAALRAQARTGEGMVQPETTTPVPSPAPAYGIAAVGVVVAVLGPVVKLPVLLAIGLLVAAVGVFLVMRAAQAGKAVQTAANELERERTRRREEIRSHADAEEARFREELDREKTRGQQLQRAAQEARHILTDAERALERAEAALREHQLRNDSKERRRNAQLRVQEAGVTLAERHLTLPADAASAEYLARERDAQLPQPGATVVILKSAAVESEKVYQAAVADHQKALKSIIAYLAAFTATDEERDAVASVRDDLRRLSLPVDPELLDKEVQNRRHVLRDAAAEAKQEAMRHQVLTDALAAARKRRDAFAATWKELTNEDMRTDLTLETGDQVSATLVTEIEAQVGRADAALRDLSVAELEAKRAGTDTELGRIAGTLTDLTRAEAEPRQTLSLPSVEETALADLLSALLAVHPKAMGQTPDHWRDAYESAQRDCRDNRSRRRALADSAGIGEDHLDQDAEQRSLEEALFERDKNNAARDILKRTRSAIIDRVMPGTQLCVKRILPRLTDDRYRDIRWIADDNRIEVLDSKKGDYVAKRVFSGGARDQISLALRLAFALSTLPGGNATRPGWLFLDEPLSAFDEKRTQSLIALLTGKGAFLRKQFPQIFLVSHSKSFDPNDFDHRITLADGKIVTSSLVSA